MLIYAISDRRLRPDLAAEELIEAMAGSGADRIQIREKDLPARRVLDLVRRAVASQAAPVFVNGRVDVALCGGARGVHLPASGIPVEEVRRLWGDRLEMGVSTHGLEEARRAERSGADYILFGPVFDTESKRRYGAPQGTDRLARVAASVGIPVYAVGGITAANAGGLAGTGIAGVAMISAIVGAADMSRAVEDLREAMER